MRGHHTTPRKEAVGEAEAAAKIEKKKQYEERQARLAAGLEEEEKEEDAPKTPEKKGKGKQTSKGKK